MDKAVMWGLADSNPVISVPRAVEPERTRYITDSEYSAIHAQAGDALKIIMELCYLTGQRIGDVLAIRLVDLLDNGIAFKQQKTGARLIVEWTPELHDLIAACKSMGGNVRGMHLLCYNGKPWEYHAIWEQWKAACEAAGVLNAHMHDLRAKSLTDATKQGIDARALAGHTSQKQTDHYVKQRVIPVVKSPKFGTGF
jgi:integrase